MLLEKIICNFAPDRTLLVKHQKLNQTAPSAPFGWVSGVQLFALLVLLCMLCLLCFAYLVCFTRFAGFALLGLLAWLAYSAWLAMCSLGLVWLGSLASWHALDFEQKNPWNLSKKAPTPARFEVEHDFLKTHVPSVILKLVCQHSNFTRFLNP